MIRGKDGEFSLSGLKSHTGELIPFYLRYDKPCEVLALGLAQSRPKMMKMGVSPTSLS